MNIESEFIGDEIDGWQRLKPVRVSRKQCIADAIGLAIIIGVITVVLLAIIS